MKRKRLPEIIFLILIFAILFYFLIRLYSEQGASEPDPGSATEIENLKE